MSRAARSPRFSARCTPRPSGANGSSATRPLSSCHVPATKPSTRIVACTMPVVRDDPRRRKVAQDPRPVGVREHEIVEARNQPHGSRRVGVRQRRPRKVVEHAPLLVAERPQRLPLERGGDRREARDAGPLPDVLLRRRAVRGEIAAHELVECLLGRRWPAGERSLGGRVHAVAAVPPDPRGRDVHDVRVSLDAAPDERRRATPASRSGSSSARTSLKVSSTPSSSAATDAASSSSRAVGRRAAYEGGQRMPPSSRRAVANAQ